MGARSLVLVLALSGCDVILGLDRRPEPSADAALDDAAPPPCPAGYEPIALETSRYKVLLVGATFDQQKLVCATDGTHLVALDSMDELTRVKERVVGTPGRVLSRFYVGVVQDFDSGAPDAGWYLVTGEPLLAALWSSGQPNDGGGDLIENNIENRAMLITDTIGLYDAGASLMYGGVCECDGKPAIR